MAEEWAKTVARKVEGRIAEEAERAATQRKRFEEGVERFRQQILDLVAAVNAHIEAEASRIQVIVVEDGLSLAAGYKRVVTLERLGAEPGVPACVGKIVVQREDRKAPTPAEPEEIYITAVGTQTAFYRRAGKDLKQVLDADFRQLVEYFAT